MNQRLNFKVNLMDRDFTVACEDGEQDDLLAAAAHLDQQMRTIQHSGKVIGHERCAIMAALNIANEYLTEIPMATGLDESSNKKLDHLISRVENVIDQ